MKPKNETLIITGTPQIYNPISTAKIIWSVFGWLLPAAGWGVYLFGIGALKILLVAIVSAVIIEAGIGFVRKEFTLFDGSACLTGLLIGMSLPPTVPLFIPILASSFALGVVKWSFGGLGKNWMNPALAGWAFVSLSFPDHFRSWLFPRMVQTADVVTSVTPLTLVKNRIFLNGYQDSSPMEILSQAGFPRSLLDGSWTDWMNSRVLDSIGVLLPPGYIDLFFGFIPGAIGETSSLLLLLGTVTLIGRGILPWEVPLSVFSAFGVLVFLFGGYGNGIVIGTGDVLFHLLTGGILLGTFYMATDLVTSPLTRKGLILYGVGIGVLTFLIRTFGGAAEGIGYAILFMNVFVPLINKLFTPGKKTGK